MITTADADRELDDLAARSGGYFAKPDKESIAYTDLLFDICNQFGIRYYTATEKERYFVEEVTRVTWELKQHELMGIKGKVRPSFSA